MRATCAWTTSVAETAPERIAAAVSTADHCHAGPFGSRRGVDLPDAPRFAALATCGGDIFAAVRFEDVFLVTFLVTAFLATRASFFSASLPDAVTSGRVTDNAANCHEF